MVTCGSAAQRSVAVTGNPGALGATELRRLADLTGGLKVRIRALLDLSPGDAVLDVGCGLGLDATAMARSVCPGGWIAGIDYDPLMIRDACGRPSGSASPVTIRYVVADAARIPYRDAVFDRCYSERVLQHTSDPCAVITEMVRVTKRGGLVVAADTDWATLSIDAPDPESERALVGFVGATLCSGYAGRQLRRLFKEQALVDVHTEVWPIVWTDYASFRATSLSLLRMESRAVRAGILRAADLARLERAWTEADRLDRFFASGSIVVARGRRT